MDKSEEKRLLLVDGHSILNRAFYGIHLLTNSEGQPTNAVYGFMNILLKVIEEEQPTHIGVAFDNKHPTFRHKMFKEYKGTRKGMPDELRQQVPVMKELLNKVGIEIFSEEGYEADDVLGTLGHHYEEKGFHVTILSGDRDLLQLATENVKIKIPKTSKGKTEVFEYYAKDVEAQYGVTPTEFIDVKALWGDTADNIPGVPSIGEKTATKIIQQYHDVETAIANAVDVKPKRASENLVTYAEQARMSKELATICIDCPFDQEITPYHIQDLGRTEAIEYMKWLELKRLIERIVALGRKEAGEGEEEASNEELTAYELIDNKEKLQGILEMKEEKAIKFIENYLLISNKDHNYILDLEGHIDLYKDLLKAYFEDSSQKKICYHGKDAYHFLWNQGMDLKGVDFDVMIASYLLNPTKDSYEISDIAFDALQKNLPTEEMVLGKGKKKLTIRDLPEQQRYTYLASIGEVTYQSEEILREELEKANMTELFYKIELPLIEVLASMEHEGIKVNVEALEVYGNELKSTIDTLEKDIYEMAGEAFNINSPKQLGVILFEKLSLPVIKKTKTGYSTAADVLDKLKPEHPIIEKILEYRQYVKLNSTYVEGLFHVINKETSKINSTFNQTVTATGRISSTEPNLQNIPIKMELGRLLRKVFIPSDEERLFVDADYSQIELRLMAALSQDETMINAYKDGADIHRLTASQVFNTPFEEVTSLQRSNAKAVNFGIIYGISAFSLSQDLGITRKEAQSYIDEYFKKYPRVKVFLDLSIDLAKETGYAVTMFHRRRKVDELKSKNFMQRGFGERIAMNMPIQGTAADIIKIAMVNVYNRLKAEGLKSKLILQVHDELLIETYKSETDQVKKILEEEMTNAVDLAVPLTIDMHQGDSWYETK